MTHRKPAAEASGHERWLVSYADFITLLFAFFVVMFATSQTDHSKASQVSESVKKALSQNQFSSLVSTVLGGPVDHKGSGNAMMRGPGGRQPVPVGVQSRPIPELESSLQILSKELDGEIKAGKIAISMQARGLVISFRQAAL